MTANIAPLRRLPDWVPAAVRVYLAHTEGGRSLREIARREGVHASTVLRQVRRFENRRDDPLVDGALGRLLGGGLPATGEPELAAEARRLLPLLAMPEAVLAVAPDMDKAVVLRDGAAGAQRLAVVDRALAEAFALHDWIVCRRAGRVAQYVLAPDGRAMLRRLGAAPVRVAAGSGPVRPAEPLPDDGGESRFRPPPESPVAVLARRRDREGHPFLSARQVAAAERLREDFEVAGLGPRAAAELLRMLAGPAAGPPPAPVRGSTPAAARARLQAALAELGPGLGDAALRCCCWQEGVETVEQALGWSARSGKIVLRIALERLARHYEAQGEAARMIG